jgi:Tfp pilus assembly protein PilF
MSEQKEGSAPLTVLLLLVSSLTGCASWRPTAKNDKSVTEVRNERHAHAVQAFEQQRDEAQLKAALDRWQHGDVAGCESRLRSLVQRKPQYCEAHVHLAELAWSYDNADEAIAEYRAALALAPQRADIHHALGLVLEAVGHSAEAQQHLSQAATLDSNSELYREAVSTKGSGVNGGNDNLRRGSQSPLTPDPLRVGTSIGGIPPAGSIAPAGFIAPR